eukprot:9000349-Pyramimonas_sp.AAC.1
MAAAITLAFRIYGSCRYAPSEVSASDGLSRGGSRGAAPETVLAHSDRARAPELDARALGHARVGCAGG